MLGFYHYEPRRYYLDTAEKEKIVSELETNHSSLTLPKKSAFIASHSYPREMFAIREAEWDVNRTLYRVFSAHRDSIFILCLLPNFGRFTFCPTSEVGFKIPRD